MTMKTHNPNRNPTPNQVGRIVPDDPLPLRALRVFGATSAFLLLLVLCSACKITRFEYTRDGVTVRATDARFLLRSAAKFTVEPQTNNSPRLTVEAQSSVESQAFQAFGRGLAEGLKK